MERIQSAIEKARQQRRERGATDRPTDRPTAAEAPARSPARAEAGLPASVTALWSDLQALEVDDRHLAKHHIATAQRSILSTPLDMLRTKVLQLMRAGPWRRIAITSPNSSSGKTTTSLNLAFSCARQPDQRVLLIEMDMRRPNVFNVLGVPKPERRQFSRVLSGEDPAETHLFRIGSNLIVGANQAPVQRPSELLQSDISNSVLRDIEEAYRPTVVIFDMPPMLVVDDMMAFSRHCDCALLVADAESTTIHGLDICERELAETTNVLGVVLNKCRYMPNDYSYDYYGYS